MAVKIEAVTPAKTGRSLRVFMGGKYYGAYMDSGLNDPKLIGAMIEAEITTLEKGGPWIKKWVLSNAAPQATAIPPAVAPPPSSQPAAAAPQYDERNPPPDMEGPRYAQPLPVAEQYFRECAIFVSGAVNQAIAAGKVETPAGIAAWAVGARNGFLRAFSKGGDDDIPF